MFCFLWVLNNDGTIRGDLFLSQNFWYAHRQGQVDRGAPLNLMQIISKFEHFASIIYHHGIITEKYEYFQY